MTGNSKPSNTINLEVLTLSLRVSEVNTPRDLPLDNPKNRVVLHPYTKRQRSVPYPWLFSDSDRYPITFKRQRSVSAIAYIYNIVLFLVSPAICAQG